MCGGDKTAFGTFVGDECATVRDEKRIIIENDTGRVEIRPEELSDVIGILANEAYYDEVRNREAV